jgi:hypothetical protein
MSGHPANLSNSSINVRWVPKSCFSSQMPVPKIKGDHSLILPTLFKVLMKTFLINFVLKHANS